MSALTTHSRPLSTPKKSPRKNVTSYSPHLQNEGESTPLIFRIERINGSHEFKITRCVPSEPENNKTWIVSRDEAIRCIHKQQHHTVIIADSALSLIRN